MLLRQLIPLIVIVLLLLMGGVFSHVESVYLHDQSVELGENGASVVIWMWVFRAITAAMMIGAFFLLYVLGRRIIQGF